jgi:uncharacterized protein (DUF1501 family)
MRKDDSKRGHGDGHCCDSYRRAMHLTRRGFLGGVASGLGAMALPSLLPRMAFAAPASGNDVLVVIFLRGGADGLNIVAPLGDPFYRKHRPKLGLPESGPNAALPLTSFYGLHPKLAPLQELYQDGSLGFVHAVGQMVYSGSHFDAMDWLERGTPGTRTNPSGWLGRHLSTLQNGNTSIFRAVGFGGSVPISLAGEVPATALDGLGLEFYGDGSDDGRFQSAVERIYGGPTFLDSQAKVTFQAIADLLAADPDGIPVGHGAKYPADSYFGEGLSQVAKMIKADLGMEIACLDLGGWDTHEEQGTANGLMPDLLDELGRSLKAFATDLGSTMNRVTVVTMSEFGRRVEENASFGTDHGYGSCLFVLGGSVQGGKVYGQWPGLSPAKWADGDLAVTTDVRSVLGEILEKRLGNANVAGVFPGFPGGGYLGIV